MAEVYVVPEIPHVTTCILYFCQTSQDIIYARGIEQCHKMLNRHVWEVNNKKLPLWPSIRSEALSNF